MPVASKQSRNRILPAERILNAAIRLFAKQGFRGTTTKQIAARAKVNEALIFRHYGTKSDLYAAIIQRKIDEDPILRGLDETDLQDSDDEAVFRTLGRRMFEVIEKDPDFLRLLYFSALEGHELSRMFFDTYAQRITQFIGNRLSKGQRREAVRAVDPYLAARALIGMVGHYLLVRELFAPKQNKYPANEVVDVFVDIFLRGVTKS